MATRDNEHRSNNQLGPPATATVVIHQHVVVRHYKSSNDLVLLFIRVQTLAKFAQTCSPFYHFHFLLTFIFIIIIIIMSSNNAKWIPTTWGSYLSGSIHQSHASLYNPGVQCVAMSATAIVHARQRDAQEWNGNVIDGIIRAGDLYYGECIRQHVKSNQEFLSLEEVRTQHTVMFNRRTSITTGNIIQLLQDGVSDHVNQLFPGDINQYAIIIANGRARAIFRQNGQYFCFDSHPLNRHLEPDGFAGTAKLMRYMDKQAFIDAIMQFVGNGLVDIAPVQVVTQGPMVQPEAEFALHNGKMSANDFKKAARIVFNRVWRTKYSEATFEAELDKKLAEQGTQPKQQGSRIECFRSKVALMVEQFAKRYESDKTNSFDANKIDEWLANAVANCTSTNNGGNGGGGGGNQDDATQFKLCKWFNPKTGNRCVDSKWKSTELLEHIKREHKPNDPVCYWNGCKSYGKVFSFKDNFYAHIRDVHAGIRRHQCKLCPSSFNKLDTLKDHERTHTGERTFKCSICSASFKQRQALNRHVLTHGPKQFDCSICKKTFSRTEHLKTHMKIHTREGLRKCPNCDYESIVRSNLRKHMKLHADCPSKCPVCNETFPTKFDLNTHSKTHRTGGHKCPFCDYATGKKSNLKSHIKTQHS